MSNSDIAALLLSIIKWTIPAGGGFLLWRLFKSPVIVEFIREYYRHKTAVHTSDNQVRIAKIKYKAKKRQPEPDGPVDASITHLRIEKKQTGEP